MNLSILAEGEFCTQTKIYKQKNDVFNSIAVTALIRYHEMIGTPNKLFLILT